MGITKILAETQNLWMKLNLRGAILTSLSLQVFLIFFAPIRKRCSNRWIVRLTWSSYLLSDLVADYALGLMAKALFTGGTSESKADAYGDLTAFWAPFLLLHLGGPDTITAFALEDNELWARHLLNLLFQLGAAGYVFYQSLSSNKLIVPTILMFIGGTTKYIERTRALYLASFSKFRDSLFASFETGPENIRLMEKYTSKRRSNIPASIERMPEHYIEDPYDIKEGATILDDRQVIMYTFYFFTTFKGLLVDLIFSYSERRESMMFFRSITSRDAFRIIEAELNFFYDVLYTKAAVVHCPAGYLFRAISIGSIITAFALFYVLNKHGFHEYDIQITYTLLLGAVGLEFVALSMLICSDWTITLLAVYTKHPICWPIKFNFIDFLLKFKCEESWFAWHILHARWSKSIFQYNLMDARLRRWPKWIEKLLDLISLQEFFDDLKFGRIKQYNEELGELIFDVLKKKSSAAGDPENMKEMCTSRGKWALDQWGGVCMDLFSFVRDDNYGESLLMWHIATELCYNNTVESTNNFRENSKILSDYMLHLMIKQPDTMSAEVGLWKINFRDTCAEMDNFIKEEIFNGVKMDIMKKKELVCKRLLAKVGPADVKRSEVKSILFDACILTSELLKLEETKWKIVSQVWVEMLTHAAFHCQRYVHAQQLGKGGELITLVWLLMAHLGLSELFQPIASGAKLIVEK